jgi:hypothetical protein
MRRAGDLFGEWLALALCWLVLVACGWVNDNLIAPAAEETAP